MHVIDCREGAALPSGGGEAIAAAAHAGGVILFPTDTLYGLGVDPLSDAALGRLFRLKGREGAKAVPVLLADASLVGRFAATVPAPWRTLIARLWPGPLTLLFPAAPGLPRGIRSDSGEVALRVPGSALCRAVLAAAGGALTGTSANRAGGGGTGDPAAALRALGAGVDVVVDAGALPESEASTLLGLDASGVVERRAGAEPAARWRTALRGCRPGRVRGGRGPRS